MGNNIAEVSNLVSSYVKAMHRAGIQCALKHFPGHPNLSSPPSVENASVHASLNELRPYFEPFSHGIAAGADAMLLSPVLYPQIDADIPTPLSMKIINLLKVELKFPGLVITCDLDHKVTQRKIPLGQVAVSALRAGSDLLMISPNAINQIPLIVYSIVEAINEGKLGIDRLVAASNSVKRSAV